MRLLTDTCAAIKLAAFDVKLFTPGVLKSGDLVIHPRVFNETKKWPPYKKQKYSVELEVLGRVRATPGLRPSTQNEVDSLESIIISTMEEIGKPIGAADREQIASAMHCNAEIVTNDGPFSDVAEALEIKVHTAERISIEAYRQKVISKDEINSARQRWAYNQEKKPFPDDHKELDAICK